MIDKPGVYDLTMEEYHADPCAVPSVSRSVILDIIGDCPFKAWYNHPGLNSGFDPKEDAEKFDLGTAAHSLLLTGIDNATVIEADDWRTKAAKEERDKARKAGRVPLLARQYEAVDMMVGRAEEQIYNHCNELDIKDLQRNGVAEKSYIWKEDLHLCPQSVWFRARPDWISSDFKLILDYKTTGLSANPDEWVRAMLGSGGDIQAALYSRGVKALMKTEPKFVFVVQETAPPHLCSFVSLDPQFMDMGRQKVEMGAFMFAKYLKECVWPAYPDRVCYMQAPAWALSAWDAKAALLGI